MLYHAKIEEKRRLKKNLGINVGVNNNRNDTLKRYYPYSSSHPGIRTELRKFANRRTRHQFNLVKGNMYKKVFNIWNRMPD